ncbi:MAG: hypothetical protein ACRDYA_13880 [Egibacteraceae bacterium]
MLVECAWAAARSKDSYLSAQFWRIARRQGKKRAAVAVAHSILVIVYHVLSTQQAYQDLGGDYFVRRVDPQARARQWSHSWSSSGTRSPWRRLPEAPCRRAPGGDFRPTIFDAVTRTTLTAGRSA